VVAVVKLLLEKEKEMLRSGRAQLLESPQRILAATQQCRQQIRDKLQH
jgi:hypothetical protein